MSRAVEMSTARFLYAEKNIFETGEIDEGSTCAAELSNIYEVVLYVVIIQ